MRTADRPVLSLFLCLALAVNLLAPFASASPVFVEICSGHRVMPVPVPVEEGEAPASCEACPVCCACVAPPGARPFAAPAEYAVDHDAAATAHRSLAALPRRIARAPPFPSA